MTHPELSARRLMPAAAAVFSDRVNLIPTDRWSAPSPCELWTVWDVLNHITGEHLWVPHLLRGETIARVGDRYDGDVLKSDPMASWNQACPASMTAWAQTEEDTTVHLSFGDVPASEYAEQMLLDLTVHGWDLARGAGLDGRMNQPAVRHALKYAQETADQRQGSTLFAEPVSTDSPDPQDQLLALLGRDPRAWD